MPRLEKSIERDFKDEVDLLGLLIIKLNIFGFVGMPDRLVIGPNRYVVFFEFKRPKMGELSEMQKRRHRTLRKFGFEVYCPTSKEEALEQLFKSANEYYIKKRS